MNKSFTVYDTNTGKILRRVKCPEEMGGMQAIKVNEDIVTGCFDSTYRINPDTFETEKIVLPYPEYPAYHIHELQKYINNDAALNKAIENIGENPNDFRKQYWQVLRTWAYPPIEDYLDGQSKLIDPDSQAEGRQQVQEYLQKCINVKQQYPKPIKKGNKI